MILRLSIPRSSTILTARLAEIEKVRAAFEGRE